MTQVVDSNYGVHALLRKAIFSTKPPTDGHSAIFTGPASRKLKGQVSPIPLQGSVEHTRFPCVAAQISRMLLGCRLVISQPLGCLVAKKGRWKKPRDVFFVLVH